MRERTYEQGTRNAWVLAGLLIILVAIWTAFSFYSNRAEVKPRFMQGGRDFVPGASLYGQHDPRPVEHRQGE